MSGTYRAYGTRVLDTTSRVWYYCKTVAAAKRLAKELNRELSLPAVR